MEYIYNVCFIADVINDGGFAGSYGDSIMVTAENPDDAALIAQALVESGFGIDSPFVLDGEVFIDHIYDFKDHLVWVNEAIDWPYDEADDAYWSGEDEEYEEQFWSNGLPF